MVTDKAPTFSVRVDKELRRQIENAARASVRTLSGEVVYRLKNSFAPPQNEATA